jgi:hypothetical protein
LCVRGDHLEAVSRLVNIRRAQKVIGPCEHCGMGRGNRKGLCSACVAYRRRTGDDRPADLIRAQWERQQERKLVRELLLTG